MTRTMRLAMSVVALLFVVACSPSIEQQQTAPTKETETAPPTPAPKVVEPPKPDPAQAKWETYHGPASLDGFSNDVLPDTLSVMWKVDLGSSILNPPVIGNGRVCVADSKGTIHAFDLAGKPLWSKTFEEPTQPGRPARHASFDAPLALFDSTLIACTANGVVYALNVETGDTRWECDTEWPILGTPNVATVQTPDGPRKSIFVIDESEGGLQCIDFETGAKRWKGDSVARCDGSPAVNETMAVYGSCACAIHIFSTETGKLLRDVPLDEDSQIAGGVVLLGDSIYSGSRSGIFIHVNAKTGETIWTNKDCTGESFSTPAVSDDRIVFSANDATLYALDRKTGVLQWRKKMDDTPSSPVIAKEKVLVTADGTVYLLRLSDGETIWSFDISDEVSSPSIAASLVFVGGDDGTLTAFGQKTGDQ